MFFRPYIPIFQPQIPTTFAELFGGDLAHLWDSYDDATGTFTDSISGFNVDDQGDNTPVEATINGHSYPVFDGNLTGLETSTDFTTLDDLNSWTIWGAFKTNNGQAFGGIVEKPSAFYVELQFGSGTMYVGISASPGNEISGIIPIDDDMWHRFVITCNAGAMELWIDGVLDGTDGVIAIPSGIINPFFIGKQFSGATDSGIALVGIATRGITVTEVGYLDGMISDYIGSVAPTIASFEDTIVDPLGAGRLQHIYGSAFQSGATVDVEGDAATNITVVSDTEITCTMPAKTLATVPRLAASAIIDTNVPVDTALGTDGSVFILFRAKERGARNVAVYANGNLLTDPSNATFTLGYTNKGVHVSLYAGGYVELVYDCNVLDGLYHCAQVVFEGGASLLKIRVDNGPWKSNSIGAPSYPTPSDLRIGSDYANVNRHRGEVALVAAGPIVISDSNFDNILANIHRVYGINLGVAKGIFDWTTLNLNLLYEPGNFNVGTGDWVGTASAGSSGSNTATSNVTLVTKISRCYNITVTNPDTQSSTLTSSVRYWDPSQMFGVDTRGAYIDARKGVSTSGSDITAITDQANGWLFSALNPVLPQLIPNEFGGVSPSIRTDEVQVIGQEGTVLKNATHQTIPLSTRGVGYLAVVKTTSTDVTEDWYEGNAPNMLIGDNTGAIGNTFGFSADKLEMNTFRGVWHSSQFGNGLNDGRTRAVAVLNDVGMAGIASDFKGEVRALNGPRELGFQLAEMSATHTYNMLFGGYVNGTDSGDTFKGDVASVAVLDLACVNEADFETYELWAAQSFDAVSGVSFDPRFTGPTNLFLPNGFDATSGVWKAAAGNNLTKASSPGPSDAGDGTPTFAATDWELVDSVNTAPRFEEWAGLRRPRHFMARVSTTGLTSWGNNAFTDAPGSAHFNNPTVMKDMSNWTGITLYKNGSGGFFVYAWDFDPTLTAGDNVAIDVAALGLVDGSGVGEFIVEMKKMYDVTSAKWELWARVTSVTPGTAPGNWVAGVHRHVLDNSGGGGGFQIGAFVGNIKAAATWRRDLSEWTAGKMIEFFQNISSPVAIDPTRQADCEGWWDTRSVIGTVGSGAGTATIKNQSKAHPETSRDLVEVPNGGAFVNSQTLSIDPGYNNEYSIDFAGDGAFDSQVWSSIVEQELRIYFVANWAASGNLFLVDCTPTDPASTTRVALLDDAVGGWYLFAGNSITGGSGNNAPHVGCAIFNGSASEIYINDSKTPVFTGDAGALDMLSLRLGARFNDIAFFVGRWAALGVYKGKGDYFERKRMFDLLKSRYGIV